MMLCYSKDCPTKTSHLSFFIFFSLLGLDEDKNVNVGSHALKIVEL